MHLAAGTDFEPSVLTAVGNLFVGSGELVDLFFNHAYFDYIIHSDQRVQAFTPFPSIQFALFSSWCVMELFL